MKKKIVLTVTALTLVLCFAVAGTLAWLVAHTDPVTNTFTVGDINITLTESTTEYKMVPGNTISKDPTVTVKAGSEACWLFVKVEKSANFDNFMTYSIDSGWTELTGVDGVYYREVGAATVDESYSVLAGNKVTVMDTVTKDDLTADDFKQPTLTFTAYAVQKDNITTATAAWNQISQS